MSKATSMGEVTVSSIGGKIIIAQRRPGQSCLNPYRVSIVGAEEARRVAEQILRNASLLEALEGTLLE